MAYGMAWHGGRWHEKYLNGMAWHEKQCLYGDLFSSSSSQWSWRDSGRRDMYPMAWRRVYVIRMDVVSMSSLTLFSHILSLK